MAGVNGGGDLLRCVGPKGNVLEQRAIFLPEICFGGTGITAQSEEAAEEGTQAVFGE